MLERMSNLLLFHMFMIRSWPYSPIQISQFIFGSTEAFDEMAAVESPALIRHKMKKYLEIWHGLPPTRIFRLEKESDSPPSRDRRTTHDNFRPISDLTGQRPRACSS